MTMSPEEITAYDDGFRLGRFVKESREEGINPDVRWDIADDLKLIASKEGREAYMKGVRDGAGET